MAIWAVLVVACLAATWLVVWATDAVEGIQTAWMPTYEAEPFAGVEMALAPLGRADCNHAGGPALPSTGLPASDPPEAFGQRLLDRGYAPANAWSDPQPLPLSLSVVGLEGGCGVLAVLSEGTGSLTAGRVGERETQTNCGANRGVYAVCAGEHVELWGTGPVRVRSFLMPGLPPSARDDALPLPVRLAHAEAEAQLRRLGWLPDDEIVAVTLAPTPSHASHQHNEVAPATPATGCVPWVVVGTGVRSAIVTWKGRHVSDRYQAGGFVLGVVSCAAVGGGLPFASDLLVDDADGDGGMLYFRPYQAHMGPTIPGNMPAAPAAADMHLVDVSALSLPPSVPMQSDGASP